MPTAEGWAACFSHGESGPGLRESTCSSPLKPDQHPERLMSEPSHRIQKDGLL